MEAMSGLARKRPSQPPLHTSINSTFHRRSSGHHHPFGCGHVLSSTLADLGGVGEGILHAVPDTARNFDTIAARPGHERNLMAPYFATYRGDCIAEGQECFWIPGGRSGLELSRLGEIVRPEGDDGEQTE